jgi:predicted RNase H-like HicB family nuclease
MSTARYVHWQDGEMWLGYFEEYPDYLTQGDSPMELEENLRDLYKDLTSGEIPGIRKILDPPETLAWHIMAMGDSVIMEPEILCSVDPRR